MHLPDAGGQLTAAPPARRVALGPSLGRCREDLAKRLGPGWAVDHWISTLAVPDSEEVVVVLGTAEMALGESTVGRRGRSTSLVVGTAPSALGGSGWAALPDLIADAIERLGRPLAVDHL